MRTIFSGISKGLFLFSSMIDFIMWRYSALRDLFMLLVKIGAVIATFEFFLACSNRPLSLGARKGGAAVCTPWKPLWTGYIRSFFVWPTVLYHATVDISGLGRRGPH